MSFITISKLYYFIKVCLNEHLHLNMREGDIIIQSIKIENDSLYNMEFKIRDNLYCIKHFEPLEMVQGVDYGMGPWYDCYLFDKVKNEYVKIELDEYLL